jgi:Fe-S-cluster containining protein
MEKYLSKRAMLFNAGSTFSCIESCECHGCKEPNLHVPVSLVDLFAVSMISGRKATDLFEQNAKIGFDPIRENEPWIGRVTLELKKPCHFLGGKECFVYPGRPVACALFPEYYFMMEHPEQFLQKEIFQNYPCIQKPFSISQERREALQQLWRISAQEVFLSDFYLFGISPLAIDFKNMIGEEFERMPITEDGRMKLPHQRIEGLLFRRLEQGGYLNDWEAKIESLDRVGGIEELARMKPWTDQMTMALGDLPLTTVYQFDGNQLHPIHLHK